MASDAIVDLSQTLLLSTLLVVTTATVVAITLRLARVRSPRVRAFAWLLVLLQGWSSLGGLLPWPEWARINLPRRWLSIGDTNIPQQTTPAKLIPMSQAMPLAIEPSDAAGLDRAQPSDANEAIVVIPPERANDPLIAVPEGPNEADAPSRLAIPNAHRIENRPQVLIVPQGYGQPAARPSVVATPVRVLKLAITTWLAGIVAIMWLGIFRYLSFLRALPAGRAADPAWQTQWDELCNQAGVAPLPLCATASLGPMLARLPSGYRLYVPAEYWRRLEESARRAILLHELAHYQRGDGWKALAVRVLALPQWFNPITWWVVRRWDEMAEWAADDAVRRNLPDEVASFAAALLELGQTPVRSYAIHPAAQGSWLTARIRRMLVTEMAEDGTLKKLLLMTLAGGVLLFAVVGWQSQRGRPPQPRPAIAVAGDATIDEEVARKEDLQYDSLSFDEWLAAYRRELNPERRRAGIRAFAAFARHGYGEKAVEAIVDGMRDYDVTMIDGSAEGQLKEAAHEVFTVIDSSLTLPVLTKGLSSPYENCRTFVGSVLLRMSGNGVVIPPDMIESLVNASLNGDENSQSDLIALYALRNADPRGLIGRPIFERIFSNVPAEERAVVFAPLVPEPAPIEHSHVQLTVGGGMGGMGPMSDVIKLQEQQAYWREIRRNQAIARKRQGAWSRLVYMGPVAEALLPTVIARLPEYNPVDQVFAMYFIRAMGPTAISALDPVNDMLAKAVEGLKQEDQPGDLTPSIGIAHAALDAIGAMGPAGAPAVPNLLAALALPNTETMARAAEALAAIGEPAATQADAIDARNTHEGDAYDERMKAASQWLRDGGWKTAKTPPGQGRPYDFNNPVPGMAGGMGGGMGGGVF